MKTVEEIIKFLQEALVSELNNTKESFGHMWSQAVGAMDAYQQTLDFIREENETT